MAGQVKLLVNDVPVDVEGFVAVFFEHTIEGMLQSLRGTGDIGTLEIAIAGDGEVSITLNNAQVPVNPFVGKAVNSTIRGMIAPLRGVGEVNTARIFIQR